MDNVLDDLENKVDEIKCILYKQKEVSDIVWQIVDSLEKYIQSLKEIN